MKNAILFFICVALCSNLFGQTKPFFGDSTEYVQPLPSVLLKTNPIFPLLWGPIPLTAEYRLVGELPIKTNQTILLMGSYLSSPIVFDLKEVLLTVDTTLQPVIVDANGDRFSWDILISGYRGQFMYRFYTANEAPKGFYIGPHLSYSYAKYRFEWTPVGSTAKQFPAGASNDEYLATSYLNLNAIAGYQFIVSDVFAFDMYGGLGINQRTYTSNYSDPQFDEQLKNNSGIVPKLILGFTLGAVIK